MKKAFLNLFFLFFILEGLSGQTVEEDYAKLKQEIINKRDSLQSLFLVGDSIKQDSIIKYACEYLFDIITDDIFSYWYGTKWDFNGQSKIPKQGKISCGFFVTTVLYDAGFNIPRIKWAQLASEIFIKKLTTDIKRFSLRPIEDVKAYVEKRGNKLYIAGLDCHVGFIYKNQDKIKFVNSNFLQPSTGVMEEDFETTNLLNISNYRVLGCLLDDDMVKKWLSNYKYE